MPAEDGHGRNGSLAMPTGVGVGTWQLGGDWGGVNHREAINLVRDAYEQGVRLFDTALEYGGGQAETIVGRALLGAEDAVVITKIPPKDDNWSLSGGDGWRASYPPEWVRECVERSARHLRVEQLDVVLLHTWDPAWGDGALEELRTLQGAGRIQLIGVSTLDFSWALGAVTVDVWEVNHSAIHMEPHPGDLAAAHGGAFVVARCALASGALVSDWGSYVPGDAADWRRNWVDDEWWVTQRRNSEVFRLICARFEIPPLWGAIAVALAPEPVGAVVVGLRDERQLSELTATRSSLSKELPSFIAEIRRAFDAGSLRPVFLGAGPVSGS